MCNQMCFLCTVWWFVDSVRHCSCMMDPTIWGVDHHRGVLLKITERFKEIISHSAYFFYFHQRECSSFTMSKSFVCHILSWGNGRFGFMVDFPPRKSLRFTLVNKYTWCHRLSFPGPRLVWSLYFQKAVHSSRMIII